MMPDGNDQRPIASRIAPALAVRRDQLLQSRLGIALADPTEHHQLPKLFAPWARYLVLPVVNRLGTDAQ